LTVHPLLNRNGTRWDMYDVRYNVDFRKRFQDLLRSDPSLAPKGLVLLYCARRRSNRKLSYSAIGQSDGHGSVGYSTVSDRLEIMY